MSFQGIEEAYNRISNMVNKTPVMTSRTLNQLIKANIFFKCENFQRVGAFKFRGAYNAISLLSENKKKKGIITHSSGNHAQAVALAASLLGIKATIVMPRGAPINKINATKSYGAKIVFCENSLESRIKTAEEIIKDQKLILIHPFDNDDIINGQGTAAYELIKEIGSLDIVITPLGGGGLLSGTALATKGLNQNTKVIGVEPTLADDALKSLKAGYIIPSTYPDTIADGLRTSLSERTFNIIRLHVDDIVTVTEIEIIEAMKFLWERMKIKKVGAILSGGNIDIEPFFQILEKKIA